MDKSIRNYIGIAIVVAMLLSVVSFFWYVNVYSRSIAPTRSFSVSAEGEAVAVPDVAEVIFGVLTEGGKNLADLQKENTEKANRALAFLKKSGVDEKDIKTQSYYITPRYQYFSCPRDKGGEEACPPSEIVGYSVSQSILVKVRKLDMAGDIVAGVVQEGVNTVSGPSFTIDDPSVLQQKAREEALQKAKEKARSTAKAGDFRLGKLISVSEGFSYPPPFFAEKFGVGKGGDLAVTPEFEPGSQEVKINVTLVYEIK